MLNPNLLLMEHTLKSSFNLVVTLVNQYNEEREISIKKKLKEFIKNSDDNTFRVIFVDDYPPRDMELNVYYVKRSGKTVWLKIRERDFKELKL